MKHSYLEKIVSLDALTIRISQWHEAGDFVVFTNGCFDLLHLGHVDYLHQASQLGKYLVVGINSQSSVQLLKGPARPIQDEKSRTAVLASIGCIDAVCVFQEETPEALIKAISPDILVKGGDWRPELIAGADWVLAHGGKVMTIPYVAGYSTSRIEQKIKDQE